MEEVDARGVKSGFIPGGDWQKNKRSVNTKGRWGKFEYDVNLHVIKIVTNN